MRGMYKDMVKFIKTGDILKDSESKRKGNMGRGRSARGYVNSYLLSWHRYIGVISAPKLKRGS